MGKTIVNSIYLFQSLRVRSLLQERVELFRELMFMASLVNRSVDKVLNKPSNCSQCLKEAPLLGTLTSFSLSLCQIRIWQRNLSIGTVVKRSSQNMCCKLYQTKNRFSDKPQKKLWIFVCNVFILFHSSYRLNIIYKGCT